jgi:hypothetical protein
LLFCFKEGNTFVLFPDCGNLTVVNGNFNAPSGTTFGQTATQLCNTGYNISGEETITCTESGDWSGAAAICTIVGMYSIEGNSNIIMKLKFMRFNIDIIYFLRCSFFLLITRDVQSTFELLESILIFNVVVKNFPLDKIFMCYSITMCV